MSDAGLLVAVAALLAGLKTLAFWCGFYYFISRLVLGK